MNKYIINELQAVRILKDMYGQAVLEEQGAAQDAAADALLKMARIERQLERMQQVLTTIKGAKDDKRRLAKGH